MAVTIQQIEAEPDSYPDVPDGLSDAAAALDPATIWQRLESYLAYRWTLRSIEWIAEGPGEWSPPLTPATILTVEVWSRGAAEWEIATLDASPLGGYRLPCTGPYRFTGTVGGGDVPAAVKEAFKRLAEYLASDPGTPGATTDVVDVGGVKIESVRSPSWMAKAMQNSGAADLLRSYRRA